MIIFLASSSNVRFRLLTEGGFSVKRIEHRSDEIIKDEKCRNSLLHFVQEVSRLKIESIDLNDVFLKADQDNLQECMILVCDTETSIENKCILGKPISIEVAKKIFLDGMNKKTYVISYFRFYILKKINNVWTKIAEEEGHEETFLILDWTVEDIENYIKRMNEAILSISGGFTVEGIGSKYIKYIQGNFANCLGFPMYEFNKKYKLLCD